MKAGLLSTQPLWMESALPTYPRLEHDLDVDVVVVGGGVTGITTAYLLRNEGLRVALIERNRVASGDTGHTTAHLTYVTDYRLHELAAKFGKDGARAFWTAGADAIEEIANIIKQTGADCEFTRVPGYLHESIWTPDAKERGRLQQDAQLAREFGFDATFVDAPTVHRPAVRFANQAKFHPRKYLRALLRTIHGGGSYVFEETSFEGVDDEPLAVHANGKRIDCKYLIIATHNPLVGRSSAVGAALFQTKLSLYTSYVLGARLPLGTTEEALFWDTSDPYDYLRIETREDHQYAIFGGEDVKTGQEEDANVVFMKLKARLRQLLPKATIEHRWLGQVIETADGLPFIGEHAPREFIATGFSGNGFTLGTASAMIARDRLLGRANKSADLFRVDRSAFHGGAWRYLAENVDYPLHLIGDRLKRPKGTLKTLEDGEGRVITLNGQRVAAFRNEQGELSLCSPVCTHLKCLVNWNNADKTWDCPCHGSRFSAEGAVLSGPAEAPLKKIELPPTTFAQEDRPPNQERLN